MVGCFIFKAKNIHDLAEHITLKQNLKKLDDSQSNRKPAAGPIPRTGRLNINTYTYKNKDLKNRKLKRKRKQKRKRGSLREGREAPPRRCPHPFRFCFRFRFNFRFFKFLFLYVYVLIFNRQVHVGNDDENDSEDDCDSKDFDAPVGQSNLGSIFFSFLLCD